MIDANKLNNPNKINDLNNLNSHNDLSISFTRIKDTYYQIGFNACMQACNTMQANNGIRMHEKIQKMYMEKDKNMRREVYVEKEIGGIKVCGYIDLLSSTTLYEIKPMQYFYANIDLVRLQVAIYLILLGENREVVYILYNEKTCNENDIIEVRENQDLGLYKEMAMTLINDYKNFYIPHTYYP